MRSTQFILTSPLATATMLLVGLLFAGCDSVKHDDPAELLALGNKWVFKYSELDTSGVVRETRNDTILVVSDTTVRGERWVRLGRGQRHEPLSNFVLAPGLEFYALREGDVWTWSGASGDSPIRLYALAAGVDVAYTVREARVFAVDPSQYCQAATSAGITVSGYVFRYEDLFDIWPQEDHVLEKPFTLSHCFSKERGFEFFQGVTGLHGYRTSSGVDVKSVWTIDQYELVDFVPVR